MFDFDEQNLADIPIVILDTETTGLKPALGHRVVEIAALRLENWQIVGELSQLVNPNRLMDAGAGAIHGITDMDLADKPTFGAILPELVSLLEGALLVAHNALFDAGFLGLEFDISRQDAFRQTQDVAMKPLLNPWLCTLELARRQFYFGRNNLGNIAQQLGVRTGRAHRALGDVYTTMEVLKRMVAELARRKIRTVGDLFLAQGGAIYAPQFAPFVLPNLIETAFRDGRLLQITYRSTEGNTERTITPLYPTAAEGVSYLIAYCHLRQEQRSFRLDRILHIELV